MPESFEKPSRKDYKFRELKVYSSTEWLADNKKKYRQVFDRYETSYIYAELSLYNKLFDVKDWEVDVTLKCFKLQKGRTEITSLNFKRKVSKYDNVVFIREGWGYKELGKFWKKGTYYWEAYIDNEKIAAKYFYVEDAGNWEKLEPNPYLSIVSLKLYEGPYDDVYTEDRMYYKNFSSEETRYIYVDIVLKNLHKDSNWQCEMFTKFYNNARELKGQVIRLHRVTKEDDLLKITAGWGSNVKGSWKPDKYTAELVFMDQLLAILTFEVADEFEEGVSPIYTSDRLNPLELIDPNEEGKTFDDLLEEFNELIGLSKIKKQIEDHANYLKFVQLRKKKGFQEDEFLNVHSVFTGNPGTGKTTVAKMMGQLYKKMGLLTKGHVHEVDRVDLVGEYIGQTAPKVREAIEKAKGGVLFIDEAYSLARANDDSKDFGREVIEILVKEMSQTQDFVVIVAGYPREMNHFIQSNPGMRSRFKHFFDFPDYLPQELSSIAKFAAQQKGVRFTPKANEELDKMIVEAYRNRDRSFGNARFVFDLVDKTKINLGLRVMRSDDPKKSNNNTFETIRLEDVTKIKKAETKLLPNIPIDENELKAALKELDSLIGLHNVKKDIIELVRLVKYYKKTKKDVLNNFFLHTVLVGNAGTGKTTVARLLTKIYKALGVLERGHVVETDREGLVAGYVGQTAKKTAEKIDTAMDGVLFVDEAYALSGSGAVGRGDFGDEAIQTLLKRMEDDRGRFFVFVAGYPDQMNQFLKANPGLKSRFDRTLKFEDYSAEELFKIATLIFEEKKYKLSPNAEQTLTSLLNKLYLQRDKNFGNAREIRKMVLNIIKYAELRFSQQEAPFNGSIIIDEDVNEASESLIEEKININKIGF